MGLENLRKEDELKSPERRKAKKPLIEKQRRRRINESLNELKVLVLQALNKDPSLYSKMEKADILDLTVNYLKSVKCEPGFLRDATSLAKYRAGYNDCAGEMTRYLMSDTGLDYHSRAKLLSQVASYCQNANLRTTADMNTRSPQAPLYIRPLGTPISPPTTLPSSIPIYPANYNTSESKRTFPSPSTGTGEQANFCRYLMTPSTVRPFGGLGPSTSGVWRPW
ncbi:transcription factor HES-4-A-like [Dendronephthya gigantea]|uniref:transcription factor HES-4-A-like n=1 Tax=Dendronephthya gigantea TaxID=151771 RepID=UPI00106B5441|nr:transcription factor HES-4-A-like [Dendronephthya gigantea]